MFSRRTILLLLGLVGVFGLVGLPAVWWPEYLDSPAGVVFALPYLSIYLFHSAGVPGLLLHNGACGWGWCPPTRFGWVFLCAVWLVVTWLVAWGLATAFPSAKRGDGIDGE